MDTQSSPRKTAVVVNADPQVEDLLSAVLKPTEWSMVHVPDNIAALAVVEEKTFDLIVTGQDTSGKEDVELLRRIRRVHPHTRLIVLTDESTPTDVIASMREHGFSCFSKPFSLAALAEVVRLAIEGPCWDEASK